MDHLLWNYLNYSSNKTAGTNPRKTTGEHQIYYVDFYHCMVLTK